MRIEVSCAKSDKDSTTPARIRGAFPRDSLNEDTDVSWEAENLPRMSLDLGGLRAATGVLSHFPESEVKSAAGPDETAGE